MRARYIDMLLIAAILLFPLAVLAELLKISK